MTHILREDDPRVAGLLAENFHVIATSWGARLHLGDDADLGLYERSVAGRDVRELSPDEWGEVRRLDEECASDFPNQDSSHHTPLPARPEPTWRCWGSFVHDRLVSFTIVAPSGDMWETERTVTARNSRGSGHASAVKAASILATYRLGVRTWGTGGASANTASLAMNRSLGYELEPIWLTLSDDRSHPPVPHPAIRLQADRGDNEADDDEIDVERVAATD